MARIAVPQRGRAVAAVAVLAGLGAVMLAVASFLAVQRVETIARDPVLVQTVTAGPHDGWSLLLIAVAAGALTAVAWRSRRRATFAAIGVLGIAALAIALLVDRRGVHSSGAALVSHVLHPAQVRAGVGLYVETLGAALLVLAAGAGLLLDAPLTTDTNPRSTQRQQTRA